MEIESDDDPFFDEVEEPRNEKHHEEKNKKPE